MVLFFCRLLYSGILFVLFGMFLGRMVFSLRKPWIWVCLLLTCMETAIDTAVYYFSLPLVSGIIRSVVYLFPLLWIGRKRLTESLFSVCFLLHFLTAASFLSIWMFLYFTPHYGSVSAACSTLFINGLLSVAISWYFRKVVIPMLQTEGSRAEMGKQWLWVVPASFYAISVYSCFIQAVTESPMGFAVIYMVLNTVLDMFICWILGNYLKESEQVGNLEHERQLLSIMRIQYEGIWEKLEQAGQMRHDMRHFVISVNGFLQDGDIEGLKNYLLEYSAVLSQGDLKNISYCSNSTVNAVAGYYLLTAEREGIETRFDCRIMGKLPVSDLEISGILGNLLENALEACRRMENGNRFINISLRSEETGFLVLVVENSYSGPVKKRGESFWSSKRNEKGIGLDSVKGMVERRNGAFKVEYDETVFRVNVFVG